MKPGQIIEQGGRHYLVLDVLIDGGLELRRLSTEDARLYEAAQRGMVREFPAYGR